MLDPNMDIPASREATYPILIGSEWVAGEAASREILDKYTLKRLGMRAAASPEQIGRMIAIAQDRFEADRLSPYDRGAILDRAADLVKSRLTDFLAVMRPETGFTTADCEGEIHRTCLTLKLAAEEARRFSGDIIPVAGAPSQGGRIAMTLRVPLGIVLAVTPFNSPLNTVAHKIAPAIGAGNVVLLKPASVTPASTSLLVQVLLDAGLPPGYVQLFHGEGPAVSAALNDPRIRYVAFTGSTEVGRIIQAQAGLRRTQMELGSIAFTVIAEDADLSRALPKVVSAGYRKAGQVCTSIQVLLVHESRLDEVSESLAGLVAPLKSGDPAAPGCVTGPLISLDEAKRVESWISEALDGGATLLAGGRRTGSMVAPTLLRDVPPTMKIGCQELFGPVVSIEAYRSSEQAIARINSTAYGLASGVFTNRLDDAFLFARKLHVGGVHINETSSSRVDLMPYGGSKDSGFGREGPHYAIREMSEERVVTFLS
ncbi:Aldehyde Dehydrogenase [Rhizobium sp. CF080]|uniref:aldehyde dehydrogenase family protein n=1 Tax=Rhizobium sp. (strain CF080) TaxID=1144310 RepID=UPI00027188BE|nr:aldehyde dehydrogenase family protein [Rhizobium sp. CF080]EUB99290.1 Aldehyde Dehydrogenase [Rhizobium sp. CF080]